MTKKLIQVLCVLALPMACAAQTNIVYTGPGDVLLRNVATGGKTLKISSTGTLQFESGAAFAGSASAFRTAVGAGTVNSVSVVSANGISGTVANATSTPAITLALDEVNSNPGEFGSATEVPVFTVDETGRITDITIVNAADKVTINTTLTTGASSGDILTSDGTKVQKISSSANGRSLIAAADYAAMRTLLSLVPGTNVQAYSANLATYAGISPAANTQSLLAAPNYASMRTLLQLVPGTHVQAYSANLTALAAVPNAAGVYANDGSGNMSLVSMGITIGSTPITGGTSGRILYNNAGTVTESGITADAVNLSVPNSIQAASVVSAANVVILHSQGFGMARGLVMGGAWPCRIQWSDNLDVFGTIDLTLEREAAGIMQMGGDHATTPTAQHIKAMDVTTGTGGSLDIRGGNGSTAGGAVTISTSTTTTPTVRVTVKPSGVVNISGMPTSSAGLSSGDLWNNSGVVNIVP